jgi:hypothetical protein
MSTRDRTLSVRAPSEVHDKLDAAEKKVLDEAIERAATVFETVDDAMSELGRWLFAQVFGDDTTAAIEHAEDNAVWSALVDRSDSAKVRLTRDALRAAVLCAAYDKRLNSDAWRSLDFSRKARLVRLGDDKLLRKAAQHVLATNLGVRHVDAYVRNVLAELGEPAPTRVNVRAFRGQLTRWTERVGAKSFARQLEGAAKKLDEEERESLVGELESAQRALTELLARVQKG